MADNSTKQCPQCGGEIDIFGSCRRCGREWSEGLEEGEQGAGLPAGLQHPSKKTPTKPKTIRTRYTKNRRAADGSKFDLWQIDVANDTETEIIHKRSLMHLDTRKMYSTLGLSLRARRSQKEALLWLSQLGELLPEEDQKRLAPTLMLLKRGFADVEALTQHKMAETAIMEKALEQAHSTARVARMKLIKVERDKLAKTMLLPGQDSEGMAVPTPQTIKPEDLDDPELLKKLKQDELLELAKARLANLDSEKLLKKRTEKPEGNPTE